MNFKKDLQYYKFCAYGFLKNLRFFEPFLILFFLEKGLSYIQIGVLYSIREIMTTILEIPTGIAADTLGRRRTMICSFGSYIVSFVIFHYSQSFYVLAGAMVFFAFGEAFRTGTHKAMIFEYLKIKGWQDQKVYYYGHTRSWSQKGSALSSLIAAAIVFMTEKYSVIFLYSIVPYILDLLLMISYPAYLDGNITKFNSHDIYETLRKIIREFLYSFKNPGILKSIGNLSIHSGFYEAAKDYLQPVLKVWALSMPVFLSYEGKKREALIIGAVYFVIYMLTSLAAKSSGKGADKSGNTGLVMNITLLGGFLSGILSGLLYANRYMVWSIILYVCIYLLENFRRPVGIALVSEQMNHNILATALSAESQIKTICSAFLAVCLGVCAERFGVGYALALVSGFLIIISPVFWAHSKK